MDKLNENGCDVSRKFLYGNVPPVEGQVVYGQTAETECTGGENAAPLHIFEGRSPCLAVNPTVSDVSSGSTSSELGSSPEDLSIPVRPFKVKPLNRHVIPRQKFHTAPPKGKVVDVEAIINGIQDLDVAAEKLQRTFSKEKDLQREDEIRRRRFQKDRLGARVTGTSSAPTIKLRKNVTARKATKVQKGSRHHNSLLSDVVVPQMFNSLVGNWNVRHDLGTSATLAVQEVTKQAEVLKAALVDVTDAIGDVQLTVEMKTDKGTQDTLNSFRDFALFAVVIVVIIVTKPKTKTERGFVYLLLFSLMASRIDLWSFLSNSSLFTWLKKPDVVVPEGYHMGDDFAVMVTSMINIYVCGSLGKEIFKPQEFLKVSTALTRATPTVANIIRGVGLIIDYISRGLDKYLLGDKIRLYGIEFVDTFLQEHNEIVDEYEAKKLHAKQTSVDRVKKCIELGDHVFARCPGTAEYSTMKIAINKACDALKKIRTALMATNFQYAGVRQEPVTLLLRGRPGTFKSQAMMHVSYGLCSAMLNEEEYARFCEDPMAYIYSMQAENVYMDGYTQEKKVVLIDDILQARDVAGNPDNEAMKVIRAVNVFENQLHMSDIKDKGVTAFRAPIVIANTNNLGDIELESIHDVGAFNRRWDVIVDVCPKAEFCTQESLSLEPINRKFDKAKYPVWKEGDAGYKPHLAGKTKTHPNMCEYHVKMLDVTMRKFIDAGLERPLSYQELVDELVLRLETKKVYHEGYLIGLDNTLKEMRERYRKEETEMKEAEKELELDMETLWDGEKDVAEIGHSVIPHSGTTDFVEMMEALEATLEERRTLELESEEDCFDEKAGFYPCAYSPEYCQSWLDKSPKLVEIYNASERAASWIIQILDSLVYDEADLDWDQMVHFVCTLIETFLDYEIEQYSFGDDCYFFIGNYPFWRMMIKFLSDHMGNCGKNVRLCSLTYTFDFSDISQSDICFGPEYYESSHYRFRAMEDEHERDEEMEDIVPHMMRSMLTKPGWKSIKELRSINGPVAEMNSIRQQYVLSIESQFILDTIKIENITKYHAIHYGIIKICCDSHLVRGIDLNPDDVFKVLLEATESDLFSFFVQDNGIVDLDGFIESVKIDYEKKSSGLYRFKEDVFKALAEIKAKTDEAGGFMYRIYKQCLAYMFAVGRTTNSALKSIQFSDSMKAKASVAFAGFAAIGVGIKVAQSVISVIFSDGAMFAHSDERAGATGRSRVARKPNWKTKVGTKETIKPESLVTGNLNLHNVMTMVLNNSLFEVWLPTEEGFQKEGTHSKAGYGIVVNGTSMIMPWHFYSVLGSCVAEGRVSLDDQVILKKLQVGVPVKYVSVKEFLEGAVEWDEGEKRDVILVRLPRHFQPCKTILKHFATEQQHDHYTKFNGVVFVPNSETGHDRYHAVFTQHGPVEVNGVAFGDDFSVAQCYSYEAGTSEGDCGSPAYVDDKQKPSVLIGFHVAGVAARRKGYSTRLSQEFLQAYLDLAKEDYVFEETLDLDVEPVTEVKATMDMLGKASAHCKVPGRQIHSAIRESPLKDKIFVSQQLPARLGFMTIDGERVDVMDLSQKGYSPPDIYIPEEELKEATLAISDHLEHVSTKNVDRKVMTFEVAVKGEGDGSEFRGIPRVKSAGYPYNTMSGLKSKERFFGKDMDYNLNTPEALKLKEDVMSIVEKAKRGIRVTHVFTDSLKDERRPKEKVYAGKTRMFSGSPTELLILQRMYFGSFVKWLVCNRVDNNIAIGVNPYGDEWDYIARQLNKFGDVQNKGAGDFSGLDKREVSRIMWCCYDVMDMWYNDGEENRQIRKILFYEVVNSLHVNGKIFSFWRGSMSSGGFLTAPFNSLYVIFLFVLSWIRIWKKRNEPHVSAHKFFKYVYLIVLGDDNVYSVHPTLKDVLTEDVFGAEMLALGQVYTPEDKSSELSSVLRILEDVSFLKRKWAIHALSGKYVGPLSLDTILEMGNWIRKGANRIGDTESNIDVMLHELSLHDESTFKYWRDKIVSVLREEPDFSVPKVTHYGPLFKETILRDGNVLEFRSFASGYDELGIKSTEIQPQCGRFSGGQACLFRLTARMACGQTPQYPGTRGCDIGWPRPVPQMNRGATNQSESGERSGATELQRIEGTTESDLQQGTTHAVSDGGVVKAIVEYTPINQELLDNAKTSAPSEIRNFLARPAILAQGTLSTTDVTNTIKWYAAVPSDFLQPTTLWGDKVKGHMAFRGDLHLTIQLNASRFQQGRYMLVFIPTAGAVNVDWWVKTHTATLTETTQCPHVEFDLNCDTEATLVIPHMNVQGWSLIKTGLGFSSVGQVRLMPYVPLAAPTGSTSCSYTIFGHYENVDFSLPIIPQSSRTRTYVKRRPQWNPAEAEQLSKGIGPLESIGLSISDIGRAAIGIPLISSVAGPVKWAGDLTAKLASAFGWARPRNLSPPIFVNRQILHKMSNIDVADHSTKLSLSDQNELEELPSFGGLDVDEMSLNYIASIPAFYKSIVWSSAIGNGVILDSFSISPRLFYKDTTQAGATLSHMTPLAYVSRFFAQWRGSVIVKFKIVKTEFHTGRLLLAFEPYENYWKAAIDAPLMNPTAYLHRQIVDVRYGSEFEITIPYQAFQQYRPTAGTNSSLGNLRIYVLNSLVAPATVSSSVTILVEVSGGPDFEWAVPSGLNGVPTAQAVPQMNRGTATCNIVEGTIGGAKDAEKNIASRTCVGERIVSFRQLLKRFNAQDKNWGGPATATSTRYHFIPHMVHINSISSTPTVQYTDMAGDLFDDIAPLFAVFRGSMRVKMVGGSDDITWHVKALTRSRVPYNMEYDWLDHHDQLPPNTLNGPYIGNRMMAVFQNKLSGGVEVEFPYYNDFPASGVADMVSAAGSSSPSIVVPAMGTFPSSVGTLERDGDGTAEYLRPVPYRAIGEDASLGCFVSTIPLLGYNPAYF
jgi:hypothetical protein